MEYHLGRLLDHVHLVVADLETSKKFYRGVLQSLGRDLSGEGDGYFFADELFVTPGGDRSHIHIAFQASSRDAVHRFYKAGLASGGSDNGPPGERHYHPGYFAAFILDPDGNNIEAVHHGPARRSASDVVVTPEP